MAHRQAGNTDELAREPDFGEGLGVLLTGINAFSSHDVVASTMSHNLVYNLGRRFHFSHDFKPLLLSLAEAVLEGKDVDLVLRQTRLKGAENASWADCLFHDYLYRPPELQKVCFYEFVMWYDRHRLSSTNLKSDDSGDDVKIVPDNKFIVQAGHPGEKYLRLKKRDRFAIPRISMGQGKLCNLSELKWTDPSGVYDSIVTKKREDYAKHALMLFKPFADLDELRCGDSYWKKFLNELRAHNEIPANDSYELPGLRGDMNHAERSSDQFWERGFQILQNMQDREIASSGSGRARDPVVKLTTCNVSTGERKKQGIDGDDEEAFDVDINEFDREAINGANDTTFQVSAVSSRSCYFFILLNIISNSSVSAAWRAKESRRPY